MVSTFFFEFILTLPSMQKMFLLQEFLLEKGLGPRLKAFCEAEFSESRLKVLANCDKLASEQLSYFILRIEKLLSLSRFLADGENPC